MLDQVNSDTHAIAISSVDTGESTAVSITTLDGFLASIDRRAFRFAEGGLRQREDALDAVQETMMRMLAYKDRPAAEWPPLFWRILRSRIVDIQRRRVFRLRWMQPQREDVETLDWADHAPDPAGNHDQREGYSRMIDALATLPRRQRETFTLRVLEELGVAATAQAMGCSEGSVKTHLSRARASLQKQLEDWR